MKKSEQRARVQAISQYLTGVGLNISSVQGYEVLARALGLKNKHVLASLTDQPAIPVAGVPDQFTVEGVSLPVRKVGQAPYTFEEMDKLEWDFDVIIPMPLECLGDIDSMNDKASELVCGNDCALSNLGFQHIPEIIYGAGYAAYRLTAQIPSPADYFPDVGDVKFYEGLSALADAIVEYNFVELTVGSQGRSRTVINVNAELLALFREYATSKGANNDAVNARKNETVFELRYRYSFTPPEGVALVIGITLEQLKYAERFASFTWSVNNSTSTGWLTLAFHS